MGKPSARSKLIVESLQEAFAPLMRADPRAFRGKYRKMAGDPHAFYRGSACLFYADVTKTKDPFATEDSGRIWIHGDLHVENFGTYLNAAGRLVFDINDFDEAYLGRFTWDLQRFAASLALMGWQKALPEDVVRRLIGRYARAYLSQVDAYRRTDDDADDFALYLHNTEGPIHLALKLARRQRRADLLDDLTIVEDGVRVFAADDTIRKLDSKERAAVLAAFDGYLDTIPEDKRFDRDLFYELRDVVGKSGFGIGSAGLPAYNLLVEGFSQALDNDVVLSMKQANIPAVSRFVDSETVDAYFETRGTARSSASTHCRCTLIRCSGTRRSAGSATSSRSLSVRDRPRLGRAARARRDRRGCRPARPGDRQDPLRLRRGQRAGPRRLPGGGGHRGERAPPAARVRHLAHRLRHRVRRHGPRRPRPLRRGLPRGPRRRRRDLSTPAACDLVAGGGSRRDGQQGRGPREPGRVERGGDRIDDPLPVSGVHQRDGRAAEAAAGHPGAERAAVDRCRHRQVELGRTRPRSRRAATRCDSTNSRPTSCQSPSSIAPIDSCTRWISVTTWRTRRTQPRSVSRPRSASPVLAQRSTPRLGPPPGSLRGGRRTRRRPGLRDAGVDDQHLRSVRAEVDGPVDPEVKSMSSAAPGRASTTRPGPSHRSARQRSRSRRGCTRPPGASQVVGRLVPSTP